jgi:dolichyl-phosphate-mannose--protein O-mannosyl transferase
MDKDLERLREERASISVRLTGFLIWQSVLLLAFAEIMGQSYFLSWVLSLLGLISALIGFGNFWRLLSRIDALEGREDKGIRRLTRRMFQGRSLGVTCSIIFVIFWICAVIENFS